MVHVGSCGDTFLVVALWSTGIVACTIRCGVTWQFVHAIAWGPQMVKLGEGAHSWYHVSLLFVCNSMGADELLSKVDEAEVLTWARACVTTVGTASLPELALALAKMAVKKARRASSQKVTIVEGGGKRGGKSGCYGPP